MKGLQLISHGLICSKLHYQFGNKSNTTSEESCTNSAYWFISISLISTLFLLVSLKSSIRFDFAFLYKRPVVTLDIPPASLDAYEATYLPKLWEEETANKIGISLNLKEKDRIVEIVEKALQLNSTTIEKIGTESISFIGQSSIQIANWLEKVSKN